jgi:HlyD family secretion protein
MNKKLRWLWIGLALLGIGAGVWYFFLRKKEETPFVWKTGQLERGDIYSVITATGTVQALNTVQVGTQVSGTIEKIFVDHNDFVRAGQVIAQLDTLLLSASVTDARVALLRTQVTLEQARNDYERGKLLFQQRIIPEVDYQNLEFTFRTAQANFAASKASLDRALTNLRYSTIVAPISGVIINRAVEKGQTVASSFSTPTLFSIAADLTQMELQANVDEADIGRVRVGQQVNFTVEAYQGRKFKGVVKQVRLQPVTVNNVVNYVVIIGVGNPEKLLMPGMTATITFSVDQRKDVLRVPNSALRFRPGQDYYSFLAEQTGDTTQRKKGNGNGSGSGRRRNTETDSLSDAGTLGRIWVRKGPWQLQMVKVQIGLTDGTFTELVGPIGAVPDSVKLEPGQTVVTGLESMNLPNQGKNPFGFNFGGGNRRRRM